jgi:hypothetical protein
MIFGLSDAKRFTYRLSGKHAAKLCRKLSHAPTTEQFVTIFAAALLYEAVYGEKSAIRDE